MPSRRTVARVAFLPLAALTLAIAACSSQAPERAVDSAEPLLTCTAPTQVRTCDVSEVNGKVVCGCEDWATPDADICGGGWIPVPPALAGCKLGVWMYGASWLTPEAVWACPPSMKSHLPASLGVGSLVAGLPACQFSSDAGAPDTLPCEEVTWVDSIDTTCVNSLTVGWGYVWDHAQTVCCEPPAGDAGDDGGGCKSGSGCGGPCGLTVPPPR